MSARAAAAAAVVFLLTAVMGSLLHGVLLEDLYREHRDLLRGEDELFPRLGYMAGGYLLQAVLFCWLFLRARREGGLGAGARLGLVIGLLVYLPPHLVRYALEPFPGRLVAFWVLAGLVWSAASGVVVAALHPARR